MPRRLVILVLLALTLVGCATPATSPLVVQQNPTLLPWINRDLLWDQIVDVVDDHFPIASERRVQMVGDVMTEGSIITIPKISSTIFEPWRRDSANTYDKFENTLQTMRRRAVLRVIPTGDGYLVEVTVFRELEDLPRPANSSTGDVILRNDDSLERFATPQLGQPLTRGWIPQGRDTAMEQYMICRLQDRFAKYRNGAGPVMIPAASPPNIAPLPTPAEPTNLAPLPAPPGP